MKGKDEEDIGRLCHIGCPFCGMMRIDDIFALKAFPGRRLLYQKL